MALVRNLLCTLFLILIQSQHVVAQVNSTYQGNNITKFEPRNFFDALDENCGFLASRLETIPENPRNSSKARFAIGEVYAECLAQQYGDNFACSRPFEALMKGMLPVEPFPAMWRTESNDTSRWQNAALPEFPVQSNGTKSPSVVSIMEQACAFDYNTLANSTCCSKGRNFSIRHCGKESFNLLACSIQSVRTYVSCTAKQEQNVPECVIKTAKRINFVPIGFQVDSNGNKCPSPNETIMHLARVTIVDFIVFFLIDNPSYWIRIYRRFIRRENIKIRSRTFRVSNLGFWATVAKDICENVVLVGIIFQQQGYQINLMRNFVLFSIRPRAAVFHALLGFIDGGWAHDGLIDMISQILLSVFGGYVALFGAISANHTSDPSRPIWWKTYLAGGAMASLVTDVGLLYVAICLVALAFIFCGGHVVLGYLVAVPGVLAWYTLIVAPFKELKIMAQNVVRIIRRHGRYRSPDALCTFYSRLFSIWYMVTMFVSLVLFVGCWMFWNGFLRISGELYCPQDLSHMDLTMIGFYAACVVVRKILAILNGEKAGIEGEVQEDVTPLQEFTKMP